jgi:dihydroorotate dehydrogenase (fumarate)
MNLQTNYLGLSLAHPVIAGASPLSATIDGIRRLEDAGAAAIVTASIYEEESRAEAAALEAFGAVGAESHPEVTSYLPPLPGHPGALAAHLELIRRAADSISVPLIASLNGVTREGWIGIAAALKAAGAAAIELNLFHLPFDPGETSADVERCLVETVRGVCTAVAIPVAVKLFPYLTAPAHLAAALVDAGASGIVLFNRFLEPDIDLEGLNFCPSLDAGMPAVAGVAHDLTSVRTMRTIRGGPRRNGAPGFRQHCFPRPSSRWPKRSTWSRTRNGWPSSPPRAAPTSGSICAMRRCPIL